MKLFKIFLFLLLGFGVKNLRSQTQHVYTANWCISFSNPDYCPSISDMSFIAQPSNWIAMGRWRMISGTSISYSPNMNSMKMWADTICSIINRKCRPSYFITPSTLSAYIQAECVIKDMSEGNITYRNYNAQLRTGIFGYEENSTFSRGTMGIADKNSGICFMKVSNKACANPNDPHLPEVKSYTPPPAPVPAPVPVPVPQPAPAVVVPQAPAPVPTPAPAPEPAVVPPAPDADIPALENHSAPEGCGNIYNTTNNYYYGNQQPNNILWSDPQYGLHATSNSFTGNLMPPNPYYNPFGFSVRVNYDNRSVVNPYVQPPNVNPTPGGPSGAPGHGTPTTPGGPSGAPGHGVPIIINGGGPSGAPGSNGPFGATGHQ